MNQQDRQAIEGIFQRIDEVQRQGGPRDPEAERLIAERLQANPAAAYYLAQTVLVQEQALNNAQQGRADETTAATHGETLSAAGTPLRSNSLHSAPAPAAGNEGFGRSTPSYAPTQPAMSTQFGKSAQGGGFLAGAAQTALGVTGGVLLGSMIGGMFGNNAHAADANKDAASNANSESKSDAGSATDNAATTEQADDGGFGSWFSGGDDGGGFDDI